MKKLLIAMTFLITMESFAKNKVEFDETQEKACFAEVQTLGCASQDEENTACTEKKKNQLSSECRKLHEAKK